ncbi:hypothetical protein [Neobacillus vireti]|uniref:Uncharacterized protein n=1 Tax=Neobacillus vireti LMG 21834 TaxID=1131730 RepID=A0AB94IM28_9BACI|nr:hypothetical protein [Neobacillus vireti]ETI68127.1 hypothetical protein BAVI_14029 [Neobacillus vireti LMG 21834]KLT15914.1 hypothetical protein AA980_22230 [Neobacillus vireti]
MAEIKQEGYQAIRNYMQANWKYIELQDDTGNKIVRLSPSDLRVTWTHATGEKTLKLQIVVKGSDTDIVKPKTFSKSAIYDVATGGTPYSVESFTSFTMESDQDELTVIHSLEVPKV